MLLVCSSFSHANWLTIIRNWKEKPHKRKANKKKKDNNNNNKQPTKERRRANGTRTSKCCQFGFLCALIVVLDINFIRMISILLAWFIVRLWSVKITMHFRFLFWLSFFMFHSAPVFMAKKLHSSSFFSSAILIRERMICERAFFLSWWFDKKEKKRKAKKKIET